jgi:CHAT domain-containing protein
VALLACAGALAATARARQAPSGPGLSPRQALTQANQWYEADQWLKAEGLYRWALPRLAGREQARCLERLLAIYVRLGRQDEAIRLGELYETKLWASEPARARELALDLGSWYLALGHAAAAEAPLRRALAEGKGQTLPAVRRVAALTYLAVAAERQGDRDRARLAWRQVEAFARAQLDAPAQKLDPRQRVALMRGLAESYRFLKRPRDAARLLESLLPLHDRLKDAAEKRETLRLLAGHLADDRRLDEAERRLREALTLHQKHKATDRLACGDLAADLAHVLKRRGRAKDAEPWRKQAVADYEAVRSNDRAESGQALRAFWRLQDLHQRTSKYKEASQLLRPLLDEGAGDSLIGYRIKAELGGLEVILGDFESSRRLLHEAATELEGQRPPNLVELPRVLLNLAIAELASDKGLEEADKRGRQCLGLYGKYRLPDDLVLVETYNLLGACAAQNGDYVRAVEHFRAGLARCEALGEEAAPYRSNLLLNLALLYKAQGDLVQAQRACAEAQEAYRQFPGHTALGLAAFDAARAGMLAAQGRVIEAYMLSGQVLSECHRGKVVKGPLVVTARHCQALYQLWCRDFARADQTWQQVEKVHGLSSPLRPRTLNYRALTRECQGRMAETKGLPKEAAKRYAEAEELYEEARKIQRESKHTFPVTHFTTLWRLASVLERRGEKEKARALLREAAEVVEKARLRTYGDAQQRAAFFAQFAPGFEQLLDWCVRDKDVEEAVAVAARGRSRTLLDQLLMAGVDPRDGLRGKKGQELRDKEQELRRRIAGLRAQAQLLPVEALETPKGQQLQADFETAREKYSDVYREILNASDAYRSLAWQEFDRQAVARLRAKVLGPKKLMLVYHVGRRRSYLLLLGGPKGPAEAFPLRVSAELAERVASPAAPPVALALKGARGVEVKGPVPWAQADHLPQPGKAGHTVPLDEAVLRALVDNYLHQIKHPRFVAKRGVLVQPRDPARPLPAQRAEFLADILLPEPARERIVHSGAECLVVVPDGALHKLPFEALVLRSGAGSAYVLDEFPPLVYAPSVAILSVLAKRPAVGKDVPLSLLTVANPAYPERKDKPAKRERLDLPALWGQWPPLPNTATESKGIRELFPPARVKPLLQKEATKKAVVAALPGRRVVHIAAHGLADERFGNRFGALVLTPPDKVTAEDDGLLSLHEAYTLPLKDCEVAVLSACNTNLGPQPPLEAGVTLASGFLAAGARRVVASHWNVADDSTAALMVTFFKERMGATGKGSSMSYAQALQQARRKVRGQKDWSSPFYWAPFVLIGPAD